MSSLEDTRQPQRSTAYKMTVHKASQPLSNSASTQSGATKKVVKIKSRGVSHNYLSRFNQISFALDDTLVHSSNHATGKVWPSSRLSSQVIDFACEERDAINNKTTAVRHSIDIATQVMEEQCRQIISYNQSPDVPFSRSINPYRGCEHGCIYCYARPSHGYLDLSPGLDFETRLVAKVNAPEQLEATFRKANYKVEPIALGMNTDAYQPIEREYQLTRQILELCLKYKHPVTLLTKSQLIERDIDLLSELANHNLVGVGISMTTLNNRLKNHLEPRAAAPSVRLKTMKNLIEAGIPTHAMLAPIIPALNDCEIEAMLNAIRQQGVRHAEYILLRLPHELTQIFSDWLSDCYPHKKEKIINYLLDIRENKLNDNSFDSRMHGKGVFAQLIGARFKLACKKYAINKKPLADLNCEDFLGPASSQLSLL